MSSGSALTYWDGVAARSSDLLILIGRLFVALVFFFTVITNSPTAGYLTALHFPAPASMSLLAIAVEWIICATLILGIATRWGALLALIYVIIAVSTAHRYWEFPEAQQTVQYIFATKDLAILGGVLMVFVTGAGRYSLDAKLSGKA